MRPILRRLLERLRIIRPRRGRQEVWAVQDRTHAAKARPKGRMSLRVYRAATDSWEDPVELEGR